MSKFNFLSTRIFDQFAGNTIVGSTDNETAEITIFDLNKIKRWKKRHPNIKYVHVGLIQICITALFRQGMDTQIAILVLKI